MVTRLEGRVAVRVARPEDEAGLARLDAVAWTPASGFPSVADRVNDPFFTFFTDDSPPGAHLVAELDGRLVGYIRLKPVTSLRENTHVLGIVGLAVAPGDRRRGAASALLDAAEQHARARGARKLSLRVLGTNETAMRLYERHGFQREGTLRDEFRIAGRFVDDVLMAKHLTWGARPGNTVGDMPEIHAARRERLRAVLAAADADAALITSLVNVRYLTGLASSNAALLVPADGYPVLATDSRYALAAERDCPDLELLACREVESALADLARRRGLRGLAFEAHEMTVERYGALTSAAGELQPRPLGRVVEELRMVKDATEIALLARACAITGAAFDDVAPRIAAGMTERELAVLIERAMVDAGAEKPAFDTIVASGPNGAIPHHTPTGRAFAPGDMITIDCGARYGGYHADMTRTVVLGPPAGWQRDLYALAAAAQRAGIGAARPGATVAEVDAAARDVIAQAGHGEHFSHGLGHGVGLEIHEAPMLGRGRPGRLGDRVPITVEPGIYLPGRGGVRIEDTLVVRSGAAAARDLLTTTTTVTPRELLVL